ncbi:MAG: exosortase/archaeosortase family protein [Candidatus Aenigmarchaeota archaeon]|nr:exosortase/archaeosortase family protein [Candidatus Aenigmarchaeota archaeon]
MVEEVQRKKRIENLKKVGWFIIKSNLLAIPLYALIFLDFSWPPLQEFIAYASFIILKGLHYQVALEGITILTASAGELNKVDISWDSTGWKSLYTLAALTLAVSYPLRKKLKFLVFALPAVFLINIIRIVSTIAYSMTFGFKYFDSIHTLLWREGLIFVILAFWIGWLLKVKYNIRQTHIHI